MVFFIAYFLPPPQFGSSVEFPASTTDGPATPATNLEYPAKATSSPPNL